MMFAKSIKSYCPLQKLQHKNASYFKTKSVRKLSGFNLQWTKTCTRIWKNNLNNMAFFFKTFSRVIDVISYL